MEKPNFIITSQSIHLNMGGSHMTIGREDKRFGEIYEALKEERFEDLEGILAVKTKTEEEYVEGSGLRMVGGNLVDADGNTLPHVLTERMRQLKEEGFSLDRLVKFWNNLKENPSLRSREQLFKFLEHNGHPLTDDGCFIAYRGVTSDFKDKHTRTFDNSPGAICEMPRRDVDDDPTQTCSRGLHVAAWGYARNWSPTTVEVKVNPRDVVAVPVDYNGEKMRVCKFEVIRQCHELNPAVVYGYTQDGSYGDWDFDDDDEEDQYTEWQVDEVIDWALEFKDRYPDRTSLANRIDEELFGVETADILKILNDNEDRWLDQ